MEGNREQSEGQAHFAGEPGEDMGWGPWGHGPWGPGPHGPWGRGHWGRGPWGRGPRGPRGAWGFGGPFGGWFGGFGPGFGPFGGFGPESRSEWNALMQVGFDIVRLLRAGVLASGGDTARLGQLRSILEHTREELNAFLGQGKSAGAEGAAAGPTPTSDSPNPVV